MDKDTCWGDVDVVQQHLKIAAGEVGRWAAVNFEEYMESQLGPSGDTPEMFRLNLESPLEAIFYIWWKALTDGGMWERELRLYTQQEVEVSGVRFRLDFVVAEASDHPTPQSNVFTPIAVEVDGHTFHEKTPDQVAYRNQRDRLLQQAGWTVFHFSWAEMTTRPEECIGEVLGVARDRYIRARTAEHAAVNQVGALTRQES